MWAGYAWGLGITPGGLFFYRRPELKPPCFAFAFAHLARCAAAILLRAAWLMVRAGGDAFAPLAFAQRALWAAAILSRAAVDSVRFVLLAPA